MNPLSEKKKHILPFVFILLLALFFRLYGLNWDQGQHLHPDERFLTMVTNSLRFPDSLSRYLDTTTSPLNPHNVNYPFFVYGTLPIFLVKAVASLLGYDNYTYLTLVGRLISAIFDIGTVVLVYLITRRVKNVPEPSAPLLASFFYATSVLPIQLSHFFAVDTFLTFFLTLTFYLLIRAIGASGEGIKFSLPILASLLGVSFGLALASKISALLFTPIIGLGFLFTFFRDANKLSKRLLYFALGTLTFALFTYLTLRFAQPYLFATADIFSFTLNPKILANWQQLKSFDDPTGGFPPAVQWITTKPYIFPLKNTLLWGLGLPLGVLAVGGVIYTIASLLHYFIAHLFTSEIIFTNKQFIGLILITLWILLLFTYQGAQFVKALRYFHPIYPFLAILAAWFITKMAPKIGPPAGGLAYWLIGLFILIYPTAFLSIYSRPHSRVQASEWIYANIPANSTLSVEHWDDGLPLSLPNGPNYPYRHVEFPLYNPDTPEKWIEMKNKLAEVDYIILSSNRLYGSLTTVPDRYPQTYQFYQMLFSGSLGFKKVAEFTSRPNLPLPFVKLCLTPPGTRYGIIAKHVEECELPGISLVDDYADETFTVYDHPKVIIFKKVSKITI